MRSIGGFVVFIHMFSAIAAPEGPTVQVLFPKGVVFGIPHVSVIFRTSGELFKSVRLFVDGNPIPEEAIARCPICAGEKPTVLASKARWTVKDGRHHLVIVAEDYRGNRYQSERLYLVDTTTPNLFGLSGTISFPDGFRSAGKTFRVSATLLGGQESGLWWGGVLLKPFPAEFTLLLPICPRHGTRLGISWKIPFRSSLASRWNIAFGQQNGRSFLVASFRPQPNDLTVSLGIGIGQLSPWLSLSYSLAHLTPKFAPKEGTNDLLAVLDLIRLQLEADGKRRFNFGAILTHPYGWRVGIYRASIGKRRWVWQWHFNISTVWE